MKYDENNVIGDLGESIVGQAFLRNFRWPFRHQTVDLGVDGEVEVIDESGNATGRVIKVQVKAQAAPFGNSHTIYVDRKHIEYWKNYALPVLVCAVSVATGEVLWRVIEADKSYDTPKGAKVEFDRVANALTPQSKKIIERIAVEGSDVVQKIIGMLEKSMRELIGPRGAINISIENAGHRESHDRARELMSAVRAISSHATPQSRRLIEDRLQALERVWNEIDMELDKQNKADLY